MRELRRYALLVLALIALVGAFVWLTMGERGDHGLWLVEDYSLPPKPPRPLTIR